MQYLEIEGKIFVVHVPNMEFLSLIFNVVCPEIITSTVVFYTAFLCILTFTICLDL